MFRIFFTVFFLTLLFKVFANETETNFCIEVTNEKTFFEGKRNSAIYTAENQVLYVFRHKNDKYKHQLTQNNRICFNKNEVKLIKEKPITDDKLFAKRRSIYDLSIILTSYLIFLFFMVIVLKQNFYFFNPLNPSLIPMSLTIPSLVVVSLLISYLSTSSFFSSLFFLLVIMFFIKIINSFIFSSLFKVPNNFVSSFTLVFKIFNIFFVFQMMSSLSFALNFNFYYSSTIIFYIILTLFVIFSLLGINKSSKKVRMTHLFYYICALEILPALFLKEYYI